MSARERVSVALARVAPYVVYVPLLEFDALADSCACLAPLMPPGLPSYAVRAVAATTLRPRAMRNAPNIESALCQLYEQRKPTLDRLLIALTLRIDPAHEAALEHALDYSREELTVALTHTDEFEDLARAFYFLEEVRLPGGHDEDGDDRHIHMSPIESVVRMWLTRGAIELSVGKRANVYAKRRALLTYDPLRVQADVAALACKLTPADEQLLQQLKHAVSALSGGK